MLRRIILRLLAISALFFAASVWAAAEPTGFGNMANNLMEPVYLFSDFVQVGSLVIGGSFLFAAIIKYMEHRVNPLMVPISTVIFLLIAGALLIILPIVARHSDLITHY